MIPFDTQKIPIIYTSMHMEVCGGGGGGGGGSCDNHNGFLGSVSSNIKWLRIRKTCSCTNIISCSIWVPN